MSTTRQLYPHSLSYHARSLTRWGDVDTAAAESKISELGSPMKSELTTGSSVYRIRPSNSSSAASLTAALISSIVVGRSRTHVRSRSDTSATGTRRAKPVSFPRSVGRILPRELAAPLLVGMMLLMPLRPLRQSLGLALSTVGCDMVSACTVVIRPSERPKLSSMIFASGANALVVHDAQETTLG